MAISTKYGKINISNIDENEPVFILRAQDLLACHAIEMYAVLAKSHKSIVVKGLQNEIDAFKAWVGKKKIPD